MDAGLEETFKVRMHASDMMDYRPHFSFLQEGRNPHTLNSTGRFSSIDTASKDTNAHLQHQQRQEFFQRMSANGASFISSNTNVQALNTCSGAGRQLQSNSAFAENYSMNSRNQPGNNYNDFEEVRGNNKNNNYSYDNTPTASTNFQERVAEHPNSLSFSSDGKVIGGNFPYHSAQNREQANNFSLQRQNDSTSYPQYAASQHSQPILSNDLSASIPSQLRDPEFLERIRKSLSNSFYQLSQHPAEHIKSTSFYYNTPQIAKSEYGSFGNSQTSTSVPSWFDLKYLPIGKADALPRLTSQIINNFLKNQDSSKDLLSNLEFPREIESEIRKSDIISKLQLTAPRKIGTLTVEERKTRIGKYLEKRKQRSWNKKINYQCRKRVADSRLRVKGRFVTRDQARTLLGDEYDINKLSNSEIRRILNDRIDDLESLQQRSNDASSVSENFSNFERQTPFREEELGLLFDAE